MLWVPPDGIPPSLRALQRDGTDFGRRGATVLQQRSSEAARPDSCRTGEDPSARGSLDSRRLLDGRPAQRATVDSCSFCRRTGAQTTTQEHEVKRASAEHLREIHGAPGSAPFFISSMIPRGHRKLSAAILDVHEPARSLASPTSAKERAQKNAEESGNTYDRKYFRLKYVIPTENEAAPGGRFIREYAKRVSRKNLHCGGLGNTESSAQAPQGKFTV